MEKYILMIDDDLDDFMLLNEILANYPGLRCHYACDAATGIKMMKENMPDAVLLDINMPAVSGQDCLKMIKGNAAIAHVPVIIFSTSITDNINNTMLALGAESCMQKPTCYNDYKTVVETLLHIIDADGKNFTSKAI